MPSLHWIGKDKVINHHLEVPYKLLNHTYGFSDWMQSSEKTESGNKIIRWDNLEALKALLPEYEGKIKCIYIDPPYNTGNEKWVYNDNVNSPTIKKWLHQTVGKEWEDLSRHDKWLCMMYPRLKLLHKLLAPDGAIFISIDDNEQANLKLMMDEIFWENNIIATTIWDLWTWTQAWHFTRSHEYVFIYGKNKSKIPNFSWWEWDIEDRALKKIWIKNPASEFMFPKWTKFDAPDWFELKGTWGKAEKITLVKWRLIAKNRKTTEDVILSAWWAQKNQMYSWFDWNETWDSKWQLVKEFYFNKSWVLRYIKERSIVNPPTVLRQIANTKNGTSLINDILISNKFDFAKPKELIEYLIGLILKPWDIILDSFAGSGTTAHAVLNLNKQDGGNRKFILVEMEDYAEEITAERVKRVIKWYGEWNKAVEGTGGSFDFYELGTPLIDEKWLLSNEASLDEIRQYICYTETSKPLWATRLVSHPYWLTRTEDRDHYFYYEKEYATILDREFLQTITEKQLYYTIWADECHLSESIMKKNSITFRKIPRDIRKL